MSTVQQTPTITGTWQADPAHSTLGFAIKHSGVATFRGSLTDFSAELEATEAGLRVTGRGAVTSITTGDENRDAHLSSPDFFDAERHPELSFASTEVEVDEDGEARVYGEITIKGVTRPIELRGELSGPVVDAFGAERVGLDLEGSLDRTEFGVSWNAPLPGGDFLLANRVKVTAGFSFVRPQED
jgi:polyisoprenoid-binding protein YceI